MRLTKLPKRALNSPLIQYVNFTNGTFINLIELTKPYANGVAYVVWDTTKEQFAGLKAMDNAQLDFDIRKINARHLVVRDTNSPRFLVD